MITDVRRVNYEKQDDEKGMWWIWKETCDRCGNVIRDEHTMSTDAPDMSKYNFCCDCCKYLIDANISYAEAVKACCKQGKRNKNEICGE